MSPERWRQVEALYHSALDRSPDQRAAFLAGACPGDDELRLEVEDLLSRGSSAEAVIDRPAWERAAEMLGTGTIVQTAALTGRRISHYESSRR
jgi:hypothetical protein